MQKAIIARLRFFAILSFLHSETCPALLWGSSAAILGGSSEVVQLPLVHAQESLTPSPKGHGPKVGIRIAYPPFPGVHLRNWVDPGRGASLCSCSAQTPDWHARSSPDSVLLTEGLRVATAPQSYPCSTSWTANTSCKMACCSSVNSACHWEFSLPTYRRLS